MISFYLLMLNVLYAFCILFQGENLVVAVDEDGLFTERITHFFGRYVKDADKDIIEAVKVRIDVHLDH